MKYAAKRFKSLAIALKEIEPFVRNGAHVQTGKPFANLNDMRSREILANWLICAAFNAEAQSERLTFVSTIDPIGGDGVLLDTATEQTWPTEHVLVPTQNPKKIIELEARILDAIGQKVAKGGAAYAGGKTLVVLLNAGEGRWVPNKLAKSLPQPLHFGAVWVVGLQGVEAEEYVYNITQIDQEAAIAYVWRVRIAADFDKWTVERIQ
jgi:hypothetical protein